jgi:hypothetical protein
MPPIPFAPEDKVPAIASYVDDRPAAWIDDMIGEAASRWAQSRQAPTLLVEIDHTCGLTRPVVDRLRWWALQFS